MKKNSIHSQLASNQRVSWGVDDAREGNDEPALAAGDKIPGLPEPLLAAEEELADLMEQIEEVKLKIQMMEDKRGMESDALEDLEAGPWDQHVPDVHRQQLEQ